MVQLKKKIRKCFIPESNPGKAICLSMSCLLCTLTDKALCKNYNMTVDLKKIIIGP